MTHNSTVELLLACARPRPNPPTVHCINRLVQEHVDWEYLVCTARRNRVLPLVYRSLKQVCPEQAPDLVMQRAREGYLAIAARSLLLSTELLDVLELFKNSDILAVPLKGPVLAESLYGDLTVRSFDDLDILVHPRDAFKAHSLLRSRGYKSGIELAEDEFRMYVKSEYSMELTLRRRLIVDLHWDAAGRYLSRPFGLQLFENRLEKATLHGKEVYQPPVDYLLVYQCVHGSKNCWTYLEAVCTLAEIIRSRPDLDWMAVQRLCCEMHCEGMLCLGLWLAYELLGAASPAAVLERAKASARTQSLATQICENLFSEDKNAAGGRDCSDFSLFHMDVRDRVTDRIRYGASLVFKPSRQEWRLFRLPRAFVSLYYPLRVARLMWGLGISMMTNSQKVRKLTLPLCRPRIKVRDRLQRVSSIFNGFWTPVFNGVTKAGLFAKPSREPWLKRPLDVALSTVMLILSLPLSLPIVLSIKLEDEGPIFYIQNRWGRNGIPFKAYKFRTMVPNSDELFGIRQAEENDARVTRTGRILRATGLDELPQVLNIFRGDMSFVGPRPLAVGEVVTNENGEITDYQDVPGFQERLTARPGLTSAATISIPKDSPPELKFQYDLFYVRNQSFSHDLRLIALSYWISFRGKWETRQKKL